MSEILAWLETCWIGRVVQDIAWLFPALETLHFMGLCLRCRAPCWWSICDLSAM